MLLVEARRGSESNRRWPRSPSKACVSSVLVVLLSAAMILSKQINCDQVQTANSPTTNITNSTELSPTATAMPTTTTTSSTTRTTPPQDGENALSPNQTTTTTTTTSASTTEDYRPHPNPGGPIDSSTKIAYDSAATLVLTGNLTESPKTERRPLAGEADDDGSSYLSGESFSQNSPLVDQHWSMSLSMSNNDKHFAMPEAQSQSSSSQQQVGSAAAAAHLLADDAATLDLDTAPSSTSSSLAVVSRHGRASSGEPQRQQAVSTYTAPSSSRLSSYTPMLLQNSRSHSRNSLEDQTTTTTAAAAAVTTTALTSTTRRPPNNTPFDPIIVCYLGSWSVYRPSLAKFTPENINPFLCTHIIYAFAGLSSKYELRPFDSYNDITQGGYRKFTSLKDYNKQLKTLIAVGGWNEGSARFSKLVASPELRANFIQSAIRFLREHKFDGIDLDWEYPAYRDGSSQEDKERYAALIRELRVAFDKDKEKHPSSSKLLLSVAVPAGQDNIDNGFDVPTISSNVDFMNVLTYDYYTAFDKQTNHHAPLTIRPGQSVDASSKRLNIDWTIQYYLSLGAAPNKLVVGVPTYGRSYTLSSALPSERVVRGDLSDQTELAERLGLGARADSPGEEGPATREKGYLAYYEICQKVDQEDWIKEKFASESQGPVAYRGNQWVAYDDVESAVMKTKYVIENRLGGVMVWTLDNDDFRGSCPSSQKQENPLITAIRDTIIKSVTGSAPQKPTTTTTTTTTSTTTTTTTPAPPPPTESGIDSNELAASPSGESVAASEASSSSSSSSSLIRSLASGAASSRLQATTPDPGVAFSCKDEGFFSNPKDCKKYFWCLDSGPANLGIVAHAFTCPSGLFFNTQTEGCDYPEKVSCSSRKSSATTSAPRTTTTTSTTTSTTTTRAPPPARDPQPSSGSSNGNSLADSRNRMVIKKNRKPSSSTTTTPLPPTTTMAATTTSGQLPVIPVTNDINELVASMLQNPQFANIISNQLKQQKNREKLDGGDQLSGQPEASDGSSPDLSGGSVGSSDSLLLNGGGGIGGAQLDPKQAQDLVQLLNLIQSMGGVDKIAPYFLSAQANQSLASGGSSEAGAGYLPADSGEQPTTSARQRRPQTTYDASSSDSTAANPFVFSYAQPDQDQRQASVAAAGATSVEGANNQPQLTSELLQNLAQLESLFAYKQPAGNTRQFSPSSSDQIDSQPPAQPNQLLNIEPQPFTADDAKQSSFQPLKPLMLSRSQQHQAAAIRVQVPSQVDSNRGRQRVRDQQQQHAAAVAPPVRGQTIATSVNEFTSYLPYLEGDLRQPVGSRLSSGPQQSQLQRAPQQQLNRNAATTRGSQANSNPLTVSSGSSRSQQFVNNGEQPVWRQQQQQPQIRRQPPNQQQQQPRRRPPNRERTQRLNSIDFPPATAVASSQSRPQKSLVLLTSGPPDVAVGDQLDQPRGVGAANEETLLDRALEERLRLLENGLVTPSAESSPATDGSASAPSADDQDQDQDQQQPLPNRQQFSNTFFQPTLSSTNVFSSSVGSATNPDALATSQRTSPESFVTSTVSADLRDNEDHGSTSAALAQSVGSDHNNQGQGEGGSANTLVGPLLSLDQAGPGASFDPQTGKLVCNRRGVFAHPNSCGRFIVCAPQSRSQRSLRAFEHHCPAEHIFHDSWGRCRPKSLQSDLSKLCQNTFG